jgi:TP901 family phage tail tape measure protein
MFGKVFAGIKKGALVAGVALFALGGALRNIIMVGADFGRAIGSAAVKFPEGIKRGTKEFKALEKAAREVGATTEFTATEAAKGLNFLAKAGFTAKFSMKALRPIVDFATASELDFATAADIASDALGAFGLNVKDPIQKMKNLERVMDVMNMASIRSNQTVEELFESMKKSAAIADIAGVSIETFSATMALLAGSGIKGAAAGTAAKRVTLALSGVGIKQASVMKKLGIQTADATGKLRDQFDVLDDLRKILAKKTQKQSLTIIEALFGKIPLASAAKLLGQTTEELRRFRKEFENSNGVVKRSADFIRNDMKGSIDSLLSSIEGVKISILDMSGSPLKQMIDNMTLWVRENEKLLAQEIGEFIVKILEGLKFLVKHRETIFKLVAGFIALATAVKVATIFLAAFNLVMNMNPIFLIITAVGILIIGIIELYKQFKRFFGLFDKLKAFKDAFSMIGQGFGNFRGAVIPNEDKSKEDTTPQILTPEQKMANTLIRETIERNKLDIDIKLPDGSTIKGDPGPGITINPAFSGATGSF